MAMTNEEANKLIAVIRGMVDGAGEVAEEHQTTGGGVCKVHTWKDEPVVLKKYEKKSGGFYYGHKRNFGTDEAPDWKTCFGDGWKERKS